MSRASVCVAVVVGLHAGLLSIPVRSGVSKATTEASATTSMQVRFIPGISSRPVLSADTGPPVGPRPGATVPAVVKPRTAVTAPATMREVPVTPGVVEPTGPAEPAVFFTAVDADASYLPRSMLSVAPSPIGPVVIDFPAVSGERDRYVSELSLFIDESGRVSRVRVDGQALPRELEEAARSAFLGVRFQPGQLEGRVVRSRIRVEVSFDTGGPGR